MANLLIGTSLLRSDGELDMYLAGVLVTMDNLRRERGRGRCTCDLHFPDMRLTVGLSVVGLQFFVVCLN